MAMDKEMLLQRLQAQYLTRQEVLYKLPLNISITSFWPELVERRKLNSTVLPLHGANSKPLWYVLTDKMITASEKLCTLALEQSVPIDPYKATLTGALTEELFFTSFVEGAQIDLAEAMDFLKRGGEPENVAEQLVHNNRNAWSDMLRGLYYPLDDRMVRMLAYRLTEDMDGHAKEYRQTDAHVIAAMGNETYDIPSAAALPALMQEYYAFMANTEIHPLIKAAAGQAYLLITRPFPDGNERLARMISYIILLRSGYDFFRNVSLSALIAKESFRYYKAMQDIIRSENDGDLTYFMEYYLDLLARAIDFKAEQDQRRQREALEAERKAAAQSLMRGPTPQPAMQMEMVPLSKGADTQVNVSDDDVDAPPSILPADKPPGKLYTLEEYLKLLRDTRIERMGKTQGTRVERIFTTLPELARNGPHSFSRLEWENLTGINIGKSKDDIAVMVRLKLIIRGPYSSVTATRQYYLPLVSIVKAFDSEVAPARSPVEAAIQKLLNSEHSRERQVAVGLLNMLRQEKYSFTFAEWLAQSPASSNDAASTLLRVAQNHGFVTLVDGVYHIAEEMHDGPQCANMPEKQRDILLKLMDAFPQTRFSIKTAGSATNMKPCSISYYLETFVQRGILKVTKAAGNGNLYEFAPEVYGVYRAMAETDEATAFREMPRNTIDAKDISGYIANAV